MKTNTPPNASSQGNHLKNGNLADRDYFISQYPKFSRRGC